MEGKLVVKEVGLAAVAAAALKLHDQLYAENLQLWGCTNVCHRRSRTLH